MLLKSRVKYIQSLRHKKFRDQDEVFVAEGPKLLSELLAEPYIKPVEIFALPEWVETHSKELRGLEPGRITRIDESELGRISGLSTPNQVLGIFRKPEAGVFDGKGSISLVLDDIQDPGNLGTIIRIADWFGITRIICSESCADAFGPKVVQSSMGSISRVRVIYLDLNQFLQENSSIPVYATVLDGKSLYEMEPLKEALILIGNESKGIHESLLAFARFRISIPKKGRAESLNAAIATGITLSYLCR